MTTPTKKQLIQELIEGQKEFIQEVNDLGHDEREYWTNKDEYRRIQQNLAKQIHNTAHKTYLHEYQSPSVKADITGPGSWLAEDNEQNDK